MADKIRELDNEYEGFHITSEEEYKHALEFFELMRSIDALPQFSVQGFRLTADNTVKEFTLSGHIMALKKQWADYQKATERKEEMNKKMKDNEARLENYGS